MEISDTIQNISKAKNTLDSILSINLELNAEANEAFENIKNKIQKEYINYIFLIKNKKNIDEYLNVVKEGLERTLRHSVKEKKYDCFFERWHEGVLLADDGEIGLCKKEFEMSDSYYAIEKVILKRIEYLDSQYDMFLKHSDNPHELKERFIDLLGYDKKRALKVGVITNAANVIVGQDSSAVYSFLDDMINHMPEKNVEDYLEKVESRAVSFLTGEMDIIELRNIFQYP